MTFFQRLRTAARRGAVDRWPRLYCVVFNWMNYARRKPLRITFDDRRYGVAVAGSSDIIWLASGQRIYKYRSGDLPRIDRLARHYFLDRIPFRSGDVLIDCGANIGELGVWIRMHHDGVGYHAFEPGTAEFACLRRNVPEGVLQNRALWSEDATLEFFVDVDNADSSLSPSGGHQSVRMVEASELAGYLEKEGLEHIRCLKVEAEGVEPEVLQGAARLLSRVDFVTVDMGPERNGVDNTVVECVRLLAAHGFEMEAFNDRRLIGLFVRTSLQ